MKTGKRRRRFWTISSTRLKDSGKVIGFLGVEEYGREEDLSEFFPYKGRSIGYVLSKDYWGRGLMPEAVRAVIDYLFDECNLVFSHPETLIR